MKNLFLLFILLSCAWCIGARAGSKERIRCHADGNEFFSKGSDSGLPTIVELEFSKGKGNKPVLTDLTGKMVYSLEPVMDAAGDEEYFGGVRFTEKRVEPDLKYKPTDKFASYVRYRMETKQGVGEEDWAKADFLYNVKASAASLQIHFDQNGGVVTLACEKLPD